MEVKTKFSIGQTAFFVSDKGVITAFPIKQVRILAGNGEKTTIYYCINSNSNFHATGGDWQEEVKMLTGKEAITTANEVLCEIMNRNAQTVFAVSQSLTA